MSGVLSGKGNVPSRLDINKLRSSDALEQAIVGEFDDLFGRLVKQE